MDCDFLVVGGGIAGASAGYWLSKLGKVTIVEREVEPDYHATGRSVSLYCESYGPPQIRCLTKASRNFFGDPPADLGLDHSLLRPREIVYGAPPSRVEELEAFVREGNIQRFGVEMIDPRDIPGRVPIVRPGYFRAAARERGAYDVDVSALHQGFMRAVRRRGGAVLLGTELIGLEQVGGLWRAKIQRAEIRARTVINAAGAWADTVAGLAGLRRVGLEPRRRTVIGISCDHPAFAPDWPMVESLGEAVYFKPEGNGLLVSPGDETLSPPGDVQPEELDVAITVDRLERATTLKVRRIAFRWAGLRTFASDREPVVGGAEEASSFYWFAGQGGYGIQTAPAMGQMLASLVSGDGLPQGLRASGLLPERLAPGRFFS